MKAIVIFFTLIIVATVAAPLKGGDEPETSASLEISRVYPIAPGIWYPGDPLPEKPMRYYRVRCWPGCHRGSSHGMYPESPLNMDPIFRTSTIDRWPSAKVEKE
ncbi:MAG: hypothetical protein GTN81_15435 [Proteobacteria bacterium]|nr:hypothetical protein [Pseudomonadota bacterium]